MEVTFTCDEAVAEKARNHMVRCLESIRAEVEAAGRSKRARGMGVRQLSVRIFPWVE